MRKFAELTLGWMCHYCYTKRRLPWANSDRAPPPWRADGVERTRSNRLTVSRGAAIAFGVFAGVGTCGRLLRMIQIKHRRSGEVLLQKDLETLQGSRLDSVKLPGASFTQMNLAG